jgi:hypothetical protein
VARGWDSLFNKKNIKTQAYIKLLEAAQQKYPETIDVYDIVWKKSSTDGQNTEIFATGKTTQVSAEPKADFSAKSGEVILNKSAIKTQIAALWSKSIR